MRKRCGSLFHVLAVVPWWLSLSLSVLVFAVLEFILPSLSFGTRYHNSFAVAGQNIAPILSFLLLLPAPALAYQARRRKKLLADQSEAGDQMASCWKEVESFLSDYYSRQGSSARERCDTDAEEKVDLTWFQKDDHLTLMQCRHWQRKKVGLRIVRDFWTAMQSRGAHRGVLVTSSIFSTSAKSFAAGRPIDLIDGRGLNLLLQKAKWTGHEDGAAEGGRMLVRCPQCGVQTDLSQARIINHAGLQFWGCPRYPNCNGILAYRLDDS